METITLKPLQHNGAENIALYFSQKAELNKAVRKIKNARWTRTHRCWYVPLTREKYNEIVFAFQGLTGIEQKELEQYLLARKKKSTIDLSPLQKQTTTIRPALAATASPLKSVRNPVATPEAIHKAAKIHAVNAHVLPAMEQRLKLKAYSQSTIKTYLGEMTQLLHILQAVPADNLTPEQLKKYLVYLYEKLQLTENTLHSRINALKFYYEQVVKREKFFWDIPRPKKQNLLPKIFNQDEIASIINSVTNKKHKTMLMLSYSSGLRVSEVVALKTYHIDSKRMTIFIEQAKGKKDRIVSLSPVLLIMLREYALTYKPDKKGYLFEGNSKGAPYSTRSLQEVLQAGKK